MSDFAAFLCSEYRAGNLTETQVVRYYTRGKITAAERDCILGPEEECSCDWSTAAMAGPSAT